MKQILTALAALMLVAGTVQAQATGATGSSYPYRASAPEGYHGSRVTTPVPGMSPNTISNAAHSSSSISSGDMGSGIGGAYLPPFLSSDHRAHLSRSSATAMDNKARIWLRVPSNAQIWVEGVKTKQTGETRYFYSPQLTPGKQYSYRVHLRWTKDGKIVEENQRLLVSAGATIHRDFTRAGSEANPNTAASAPSKRSTDR
jgi:uncharacterized protein (TIGR03000 family)